MRKRTNVSILAEVPAQYFFYKVYFMYLLYILCIGFLFCYWNNAEEVFMCVDCSGRAADGGQKRTRVTALKQGSSRLLLKNAGGGLAVHLFLLHAV